LKIRKKYVVIANNLKGGIMESLVDRKRIPEFQSIMLPILQYLADDKERNQQDVMDHIAKLHNLTEEELRLKVPSGQMSLFKNRVAWAVSYLKNAGLINYVRRGIYQITPVAHEILKTDIKFINIPFLKKLDAFKSWQSTFSQTEEQETIISETPETKTPEEIIGDNFKRINNKLCIELLEVIKQKTAAQFEKFVLVLLSNMGYGGAEEKNFEVVGQSGDNGIDGIIYQDKLGIDRIYVQAKRWNDAKVQSKDIRDFIGSLSLRGTNKGVFITTSQFTEDATRTVQMNPQNIIILIDGKKLTDFAIRFNVGVQVKETYEIKGIDIDFFEEL
jgi:restriction system protein